MPRRKQFKGICRDILDSFVSRYNDLDGYWALGKYVVFLIDAGQRELRFRLQIGATVPECASFSAAAKYYRRAVSRLMDANAMPDHWLADAEIRFRMMGSTEVLCEIEIVSDLGRTYRNARRIGVSPHNPLREVRRGRPFGPSNQMGL